MSDFLTPERLLEAAKQFGTPLYVYNAAQIAHQYQKLQTAFARCDAHFFYACKALTNINILKYIRSLGANVDCSSINEVKLALHAGFKPAAILYTSNGIDFKEIEEAADLGVNVNIDSLSNLEKFGKKYGHSYPVSVRLRPNILAGGNIKISTGHNKSKFGISVNQVDQILQLVKKHQLHIRGLHIHTGSDIKDAETFVKGIEVLFEIMPYFAELEFIDLGGGFKVPYKKGDAEIDIDHLGNAVAAAFEEQAVATGRKVQIWFEPGKYMVSSAGYLLTSVNVMKQTSAATFASVNSGFNHLIRPMFYDAYHRIDNLSNPNGPLQKYAVVGNICETDTFAWDRELNEVREGDCLVFYNAGAYGFEMSSNFNSRLKPAEVLYLDGQFSLIRKRDEFADLLKNQVEVL